MNALNLFHGGAFWFTPLLGETVFSWKLWWYSDEKILASSERQVLEKKIQDIAGKLGITKKIELREVEGFFSGAQAAGNNLLPGRAGIILDPALAECSSAELEFILAHELAHIKSNDLLTIFLFGAVVGIITTIALIILFPPLSIYSPFLGCAPAATIGFLVGTVALIFFSQWRERCADELAFSICSKEGREGGIKFIERMRDMNLAYRNENSDSSFTRLWRKIYVTQGGDVRWDIFHPSLNNRIEHLKMLAKNAQSASATVCPIFLERFYSIVI
jgi:Zn-dependent protease with chaperone function